MEQPANEEKHQEFIEKTNMEDLVGSLYHLCDVYSELPHEAKISPVTHQDLEIVLKVLTLAIDKVYLEIGNWNKRE